MPTEILWHGHACFEVVTGTHRLLIDPFLGDNPSADCQADDVSPDAILLTHGHFDHVGDTVAIAKRTKAQVIATFEITEWLSKQGVPEVFAMNTGGARRFDFGTVKLTLAFHSSSLPDGTYAGSPNGLLLKLPGATVYHAGDTALFSDMQLIGEEGLDVAILPIGDTYTMGPDDSLRAVRFLRPKQVIPAHYDTWPPIAQDAHAWAERVRRETSAEPVVLKPGQSHRLEPRSAG